jgi:hypothetical protein
LKQSLWTTGLERCFLKRGSDAKPSGSIKLKKIHLQGKKKTEPWSRCGSAELKSGRFSAPLTARMGLTLDKTGPMVDVGAH